VRVQISEHVVKESTPEVVSSDQDTKFDSVSYSKNSLLDENLDISVERFSVYVACFISFWDEIGSALRVHFEFLRGKKGVLHIFSKLTNSQHLGINPPPIYKRGFVESLSNRTSTSVNRLSIS
jgi:hypothetical protein